MNHSGSRMREVAMEEVTNAILPPYSPAELAIHFLLRHTACRNALTEQAAHPFAHQTSLSHASGPGRGVPHAHPSASPAPEVTKHDSCAARFSRAYAAARHASASSSARARG